MLSKYHESFHMPNVLGSSGCRGKRQRPTRPRQEQVLGSSGVSFSAPNAKGNSFQASSSLPIIQNMSLAVGIGLAWAITAIPENHKRSCSTKLKSFSNGCGNILGITVYIFYFGNWRRKRLRWGWACKGGRP